MRPVVVVLGLIGAAVLAALFHIYSSLNDEIEVAIERFGARLVGAPVALDEVTLSPDSGRGMLRGFRIASPQGFESTDALVFDQARMEVQIGSLTDDPLVIDRVVIQQPRLTYEPGPAGSNLAVLRESIRRAGRRAASGIAVERRFVIRSLHVEAGIVTVLTGSAADQQATAAFPEMRLENVGTSDDSTYPAEVLDRLLTRAADIASAVARRADRAIARPNLAAAPGGTVDKPAHRSDGGPTRSE